MRSKVNLSNHNTVIALKWKDSDPEQVRIRDFDRMGLYIRITRMGTKSWEYRYPVGTGKYRYMALGRFPKLGCAAALRKYELFKAQVKDSGIDPKIENSEEKQTLDDLFDHHYIPRYAKIKKVTWREDIALYNLHVRALIGTCKLESVDAPDIEKVIGTLELANKLHTARKTFAVLNKMFNWSTSRASAHHPGGSPLLQSPNPCMKVQVEKPLPSDKRVLTQPEIKLLWDYINPPNCINRIIKLLILTGCRISEITELDSSEINWNSGDIVLQPKRTRNKRLHIIPLTPRMKHIIGPCNDGRIFPAKSKLGHTTTSGVRIALNRYCRVLKIKHVSPHNFRNTFISHAARIGIIREHRDRLTNHADLSVDGRHYNEYDYHKEKMEALLQWDAEITRIIR